MDAFLFFLGRSIAVSVASIRITSYSTSLLVKALRPGKVNSLLLINVSFDHLINFYA
jgi:hypothetical protein